MHNEIVSLNPITKNSTAFDNFSKNTSNSIYNWKTPISSHQEDGSINPLVRG